METLVMSEASEEDLPRVQSFITQQNSAYIITHSLVEQQDAIEKGLFFKIEDESRDLAAIASVVQIEESTNHEMANALVRDKWQGYGLQYELILVRAATAITQLGGSHQLVTAINPKNHVSLHNVVSKAGFRPCSEFLPGLLWGCGSCPNQNAKSPCCCDCYVLLKPQQRVLATQFLERGRTFELPRSNGKVVLDLHCAAALNDRRRETLKAFADGDELL